MADSKKEVMNLTHGEKLKKNIEDVKFVVILLSVLIAIVGGWNIYNNIQITKAEELRDRYAEVRSDVMNMATDDFLIKAKKIRERNNSDIKIKSFVENIIKKGARVDEDAWGSMTKRSSNTEEYLSTPPVDVVTMKNLVIMLNRIKRNSLDIWCTEINKLEPLLDEEGYASREYGNEPVYKIQGLRFSRFFEKKK